MKINIGNVSDLHVYFEITRVTCKRYFEISVFELSRVDFVLLILSCI